MQGVEKQVTSILGTDGEILSVYKRLLSMYMLSTSYPLANSHWTKYMYRVISLSLKDCILTHPWLPLGNAISHLFVCKYSTKITIPET